MSYRVELSSSGRAGCRATECKKAGIKIEKNELRMGTWVTIQDKGSWQWRHWGCVSGYQLQNLRAYLEDPAKPGVYRWDFLDGYEGDDKNSLEKHPEVQEKVRRVITQGFIDPEDFRGDPEMNKLGEKGLYTSVSKSKRKVDEASKKDEKAESDEEEPDKKAVKRKRATKAKKEEDDEEEEKPAKKSRTKKVKKEEDDVDEEDEEKPAKKPRAKKVKKEEEGDDEDKPVKKSRAKKAKEENDDDEEDEEKPAKKSRAKKVKKEEADESESNSVDGVVESSKSGAKAVAKKGGKKTANQENPEDTSTGAKGEPSETGENYIPGIKDSDLQDSFNAALDAGEIEDDFDAYIENKKAELAKPQPKKGAKGKKTAAPKAAASQRATRSKA